MVYSRKLAEVNMVRLYLFCPAFFTTGYSYAHAPLYLRQAILTHSRFEYSCTQVRYYVGVIRSVTFPCSVDHMDQAISFVILLITMMELT